MGSNRPNARFLSAVPVVSGPSPGDVARRIEARLEGAAAELEELKAEVAALAALALAPSGGDGAVVAPKLLTVRQAAAALGVGESTVHALIRSGELGSRKIGSSRRIPVEEVDAFIARLPADRVGA